LILQIICKYFTTWLYKKDWSPHKGPTLSSEDIQAQQEAWGSTQEGKKGANAFFSVQQKLNFNIRSVEHDTNVSTHTAWH
jgi:hypothetical protein